MVRRFVKTMKSTKDLILEFFGTFPTDPADDGWQDLLAPDMKFHSPLDTTNSKEEFIPLDLRFRSLARSATVKWVIVEENYASVLVAYEMVLPNGYTLNIEFSEIIETENQKIKSIRVFFDTLEFHEFWTKA